MNRIKRYLVVLTAAATGLILAGPSLLQHVLVVEDTAMAAVNSDPTLEVSNHSVPAKINCNSYSMGEAEEHQEKVYGIGSVSKMFATVAVLKLMEEGKLDLNTPVIKYIPEFRMEDERYKQITPLMLLNHSSGIMGTINHNAFNYGKDDLSYHDTFLELLSHQKLKANPGEFSVYCNDGFTLAEILVERVSGMSFTEYVRKEISEPLGLDETYTPVEGLPEDNLAMITRDGHELPYMNCHCLGSGGIYSTTKDVARFGQIFTEKGTKILSKESIEMIQKAWYQNDAFGVCEGDNQQAYGLGWDCVDMYPFNLYGIKALSKGGDVIGYHANLTVLPEQNISMAVNTAGEGDVVAGEIVQDIILQVLLEEGLIDDVKDVSIKPEAVTKAEPLPEEYRKFAGYYISNSMIAAKFLDDGTLVLHDADSDYDMEAKMIYTGNGEFVSGSGVYFNQYGFGLNSNGKYGKTILTFTTESNGKTYMKAKMYETKEGLGETVYQMLIGEKVEDRTLPDNVVKAWQQRVDQKYYIVNEDHNSSQFLMSPYVKAEPIEEMNSYMKSSGVNKPCRIVDENKAVCEMSIPGMVGRDLADYTFYNKQGTEYVHVNEMTYMSEKGMHSSTELGDEVTISEDTAEWYRIVESDASKLITISVPENADYYVYDKDDKCVSTSVYVNEVNSVVLPKGGHIVFAGEPGAVFHISK